MAETSDRVMTMVEKELKKNPDASTTDLYEKAKDVDKSVEQLSTRQFHARYPLQVKRRQKPSGKRRGGRRKGRGGRRRGPDRNELRDILLDFAREVAAAEGKADVVDVIGNVDGYVDRIEKSVGGG